MKSRRILRLAGVALLAACSSSTTTEPGGVHQFNIHEFYRLVAINGDTARVFPHDGSSCPSNATKYQSSTLTFTPNVGQFVTWFAVWYPLCLKGIVNPGTAQVVAAYTQGGSAITLTFFPTSVNELPVTGRISANSDTIALNDMPDFRGDPTWTNTAQFTYLACTAGPCQ